MRWLLVVIVIILSTPAIAQENEAEKLFRAMEDKFRAAKTAKITCNASVAVGVHLEEFEVELYSSWDNARLKARMEIKRAGLGAQLLLSDGNEWAKVRGRNQDQFNGIPPIAVLAVKESLPIVVARADFTDFLPSSKLKPFLKKKQQMGIDSLLHVSDFMLRAKERVGDHDAQVLEYALKLDGSHTLEANLWIDTKSLLPLKRRFVLKGPTEATIIETFTEFSLNLQIDPKLFVLPK